MLERLGARAWHADAYDLHRFCSHARRRLRERVYILGDAIEPAVKMRHLESQVMVKYLVAEMVSSSRTVVLMEGKERLFDDDAEVRQT